MCEVYKVPTDILSYEPLLSTIKLMPLADYLKQLPIPFQNFFSPIWQNHSNDHRNIMVFLANIKLPQFQCNSWKMLHCITILINTAPCYTHNSFIHFSFIKKWCGCCCCCFLFEKFILNNSRFQNDFKCIYAWNCFPLTTS